MSDKQEFNYMSPGIFKVLLWIFGALLAVGFCVPFVLYFAGVFKDLLNEALPFAVIPLFGACIYVWPCYIYYSSYFRLKDGTFVYSAPFKRKKRMALSDVKCVELREDVDNVISLVGKNGEVLTARLQQNQSVENVFYELKIPVKNLKLSTKKYGDFLG